MPVPLDEYRERITWLCREIKAFGGIPVLHNIYCPVLHRLSPYYQEHFADYLRINGEVAAAEGVPLLNVFPYFHAYYEADPEGYARALMADDIHVNALGNAVWGCLVADELSLPRPALCDLTDAAEEQLRWIREVCGK